MIRLAESKDIDSVMCIYDAILQKEEEGALCVGWQRGVYPTRQTALNALARGDLYVLDDGGTIAAAAIINQAQVPAYDQCPWRFEPVEGGVLVLHTLVVHPAVAGRGHGRAFVAHYEAMAAKRGISCLRMDTNAKNLTARALYARLGYREAGIVPTCFNGLEGVELVCLEKQL